MAIGVFFILLAVLLIAAMPVGGVESCPYFRASSIRPFHMARRMWHEACLPV